MQARSRARARAAPGRALAMLVIPPQPPRLVLLGFKVYPPVSKDAVKHMPTHGQQTAARFYSAGFVQIRQVVPTIYGQPSWRRITEAPCSQSVKLCPSVNKYEVSPVAACSCSITWPQRVSYLIVSLTLPKNLPEPTVPAADWSGRHP